MKKKLAILAIFMVLVQCYPVLAIGAGAHDSVELPENSSWWTSVMSDWRTVAAGATALSVLGYAAYRYVKGRPSNVAESVDPNSDLGDVEFRFAGEVGLDDKPEASCNNTDEEDEKKHDGEASGNALPSIQATFDFFRDHRDRRGDLGNHRRMSLSDLRLPVSHPQRARSLSLPSNSSYCELPVIVNMPKEPVIAMPSDKFGDDCSDFSETSASSNEDTMSETSFSRDDYQPDRNEATATLPLAVQSPSEIGALQIGVVEHCATRVGEHVRRAYELLQMSEKMPDNSDRLYCLEEAAYLVMEASAFANLFSSCSIGFTDFSTYQSGFCKNFKRIWPNLTSREIVSNLGSCLGNVYLQRYDALPDIVKRANQAVVQGDDQTCKWALRQFSNDVIDTFGAMTFARFVGALQLADSAEAWNSSIQGTVTVLGKVASDLEFFIENLEQAEHRIARTIRELVPPIAFQGRREEEGLFLVGPSQSFGMSLADDVLKLNSLLQPVISGMMAFIRDRAQAYPSLGIILSAKPHDIINRTMAERMDSYNTGSGTNNSLRSYERSITAAVEQAITRDLNHLLRIYQSDDYKSHTDTLRYIASKLQKPEKRIEEALRRQDLTSDRLQLLVKRINAALPTQNQLPDKCGYHFNVYFNHIGEIASLHSERLLDQQPSLAQRLSWFFTH